MKPGYQGRLGGRMTIRAGNVKKKENPRKALSAIMMVAIRLTANRTIL